MTIIAFLIEKLVKKLGILGSVSDEVIALQEYQEDHLA